MKKKILGLVVAFAFAGSCARGMEELKQTVMAKKVKQADVLAKAEKILAQKYGHEQINNPIFEHKTSLLHIAAYNGWKGLINLLGENGMVAFPEDDEFDRSPFFYAAQGGNLDAFKLLTKYWGDDLENFKNDKDTLGNNLLHMVASNKKPQTRLIHLLFELGVYVAEKNKKNKMPHEIAKNSTNKEVLEEIYNDIDGLTKEIKKTKEKINYKKIKDFVRAGNREDAPQGVIKAGHFLNQHINGVFPIHVAAKNGYNGIIHNLAIWGADVEQIKYDKTKNTALHIAAEKGFLGVVDMLIKHNRLYRNAYELEELFNANNKTPMGLAISKSNLNVCALLVAQGAVFNKARKGFAKQLNNPLKGNTQLHYAVLWNADKVAGFYTHERAKKANNQGNTPLHLACITGNIKVLETLVKKMDKKTFDAAIAHKNNDAPKKRTPIELAKHYNYDHIVTVLEKITEPAQAEFKEETADYSVIQKKAEEKLKSGDLNARSYIIKKDKDGDTILHEAVRNNDTDLIKKLLSKGANILERNNQSKTPLHIAAEKNLETLKALLPDNQSIWPTLVYYGARLNKDWVVIKDIQDLTGQTPLHLAVSEQKFENVEYLLSIDKNNKLVNIANYSRDTPLHIALTENNTNIIDALIKNKADVNAKGRDGKTPLHVYVDYVTEKNIAANNYKPIIEKLLKSGADINAHDRKGHTVLHLAAQAKNKDLYDYLVEKGANESIKSTKLNEKVHHAYISQVLLWSKVRKLKEAGKLDRDVYRFLQGKYKIKSAKDLIKNEQENLKRIAEKLKVQKLYEEGETPDQLLVGAGKQAKEKGPLSTLQSTVESLQEKLKMLTKEMKALEVA